MKTEVLEEEIIFRDSSGTIFQVLNKLTRTENELAEAKENLKNQEDSLYLYADWDNLKKEKGISSQTQRDAHVHEITSDKRKKVKDLEILRDYLKRVYNVLLHEQPATYPETAKVAE